MGIFEDDIIRVRETTDIIAVISQYTALRRVGQRWTGLCPFHDEKSPSFSVNAEQGLYHCFGCKASGDAITFLREKEQLDFAGAVENLAQRAGIALRYTSEQEGEQRKQHARWVEVMAKAAAWYHERLKTSPDAKDARAYLRSRGFTSEEVSKYQIGWAPDSWDALMNHLRLSKADAEATGLGFENRAGRMQDFFRGRILFPIIDERDRVLGFGGRILPGKDGAKYQNSRDNRLYNKSRILYGTNWARSDIVKADRAIICEGYTDVIGFGRAGLDNCVATCGTALTEDHIKLLKRYTSNLVLAYDADEAGQSAAERVYAWEQAHDIRVSVVVMPDGLDPDELARTDPDRLVEAVHHAQPFLAFRLNRVLVRAHLDHPEERARTAHQALAVIGEHPDPMVRDQYVMVLSDHVRIDADQLRTQLSEIRRRPVQRHTATESRQPYDASSRDPGPRDPGPRGTMNSSPPAYDGPPPNDAEYSSAPTSGDPYGGAGDRYPGSYDDAPPYGAPPPEDPYPPVRDGAQLEALKLAVHQPEDAAILDESLFLHPTVSEAFRRFQATNSLVAAMDGAPHNVAEVLGRVGVIEAELDSIQVLAGLATDVGRQLLLDLEREARLDDNPLAYAEVIGWLKLRLEELRKPRVEVEMLAQLLAWLREQRKFSSSG